MNDGKGKFYGNYRSLVVDNKDPEKHGRVKIWLPDVMPEVPQDQGLWAHAANNPLGGRNLEGNEEHHFAGSSYIPPKGSWVWVFFEMGNINRPFYFGSLDISNTEVLPENQLGDNYEKKWTLLKSHQGRCIVISDDPDDERIEITGKKRNITGKPTGDTDSVYQIDTNQTTILLDERAGKEKLLIRTYKGDFIHIDIDERNLQAYFANDIKIEAGNSIYIQAGDAIHTTSGGKTDMKAGDDFNIKTDAMLNQQSTDDMNSKTSSKMNIESTGDTNIRSGAKMNQESTSDMNQKSNSKLNQESTGDMNIKSGANLNNESSTNISNKAGGSINSDGASGMSDQGGLSIPAGSSGSSGTAGDAETATLPIPEGDRDT